MTTAADPLGTALAFLQRLWQLNHALERLSARMDRRLGVTAQQRLIVRCVGRVPGITAGQLAEVLRVDPGTVSAALRRLEQKAIVRRRRSPSDARRVVVELTETGRALDRPAPGTVESAVEALLTDLPEREVRSAERTILRLTALLDREAAVRDRPAPSPRRRRG